MLFTSIMYGSPVDGSTPIPSSVADMNGILFDLRTIPSPHRTPCPVSTEYKDSKRGSLSCPLRISSFSSDSDIAEDLFFSHRSVSLMYGDIPMTEAASEEPIDFSLWDSHPLLLSQRTA
jgi:hypothetical protein